MEKEKIALIQIARMGDLLQCVPLINALGETYQITLVADKNIREVASLMPAIDEFLPIDIKSLSQIASTDEISLSEKYLILKNCFSDFSGFSFSKVINLNYSSLSCIIADLITDGEKTGFHYSPNSRTITGNTWIKYLLTSTAMRRYNRINLADIFHYCAGSVISQDMPKRSIIGLSQRQKDSKPLIAIQTGAGNKKRLWPSRYFAALCKMLINEYNAKIILTGNVKERERAENIRKLAGSNNIENLAGKTNISDLADYLQKCRLLITCDTGTMHLAASLNTPVLALFFGPAYCFETGPFTENNYIIQSYESCSPCMESAPCKDRKCVNSISPEIVFKTADAILKNKPRFDCRNETFQKLAIYKTTVDSFGITYKPVTNEPARYEDQLTDALRYTWFNIMDCVDSENRLLLKIRGLNLNIKNEMFRDAVKELSYLIAARKKVILSLLPAKTEHFEISHIDKRIDSLGEFYPIRHFISFFRTGIEYSRSEVDYKKMILFHDSIVKGLQKVSYNPQIYEEEHYGVI